MIFSALLNQLFRLIVDGSVDRTGLPEHHPLVRFARDPDGLDSFLELDDAVVWGSLSMLRESRDQCIAELSGRLSARKLYKAIDVTSKLAAAFSGEKFNADHDERRRKATKGDERLKLKFVFA